MTRKFAINGSCYKHTPDSRFSHFEPNSDQNPMTALLGLVEAEWKPEYDEAQRHVVIPLNADAMARYGTVYTPLNYVTPETPLSASFSQREGGIPGELPFLQARIANGAKRPAHSAAIILYNEAALKPAERIFNGVPIEGKFQVVTIIGNLDEQPSPMPPVTLMRNHSALVAPGAAEAVGGTAFDAKPQDYLNSLLYWRHRLLSEPSPVATTVPAVGLLGVQTRAVDCQYKGLLKVEEGVKVEAFFAPGVPGGVPFVQFRSTNTAYNIGSGKLRPKSPYELVCSHARYLGLPEGEGLVGTAHEPSPEEYRRAILLWSNHVRCDAAV